MTLRQLTNEEKSLLGDAELASAFNLTRTLVNRSTEIGSVTRTASRAIVRTFSNLLEADWLATGKRT